LAAFSLYRRPFGTVPGYLLALVREFGPMVRLRGPVSDLYLIDDPQLIEDVLVSKARSFRKGRGVSRLRRLLGNGLLTSEQPDHLRNRRLVAPAFNRRRVEAYGPSMVAAALRRVARWRDGGRIALDREMMALALEIAAETLFGADVSAETATIGTALDQSMRDFGIAIAPFSEVLDYLPVPVTLRFRRARAQLHAVVERLIAGSRAAGDRGDFLSLLLSARDERGALSEAQARDEALTILLAGHETTANAMTWTIDLLGRNPRAARTLSDELDGVLGGRDPELADVARLPYLRAAISEALRLFPPAWLIGRRAIEPVEIGGVRVRRGDIVLVSPYATQRNPRYWTDPERFSPERWLDGAHPERFSYIPFGAGNRVCIGESFAWLETTLALATLLHRVRFERLDTAPAGIAPLVTLRPLQTIGMRVALRPLTSAGAARS
jgi:cytochrome P450